MTSQCFLGEADPGRHRKFRLGTEAARPQDCADSSLTPADGIAHSSSAKLDTASASQSRVRNPQANLGPTLQRHSPFVFSLVQGTSI